jgi:LAS superfamily LD-carboxypeptidase LdcB
MPSLQIRDLPEHLYEILAEKARRNRRSLAQQATIELEKMVEAEARTRRLDAVSMLRARVEADGAHDTDLDPTDVVREDRDR